MAEVLPFNPLPTSPGQQDASYALSDHPSHVLVHRCGNAAETALVRVTGDVDALSAPEIGRTLLPNLLGLGIDQVVFDLRSVTFIGSAGVQMLRDVRLSGIADGVEFWLAGSRAVLRILDLVGDTSAFHVVDDPQDAMALVSSSAHRWVPRQG